MTWDDFSSPSMMYKLVIDSDYGKLPILLEKKFIKIISFETIDEIKQFVDILSKIKNQYFFIIKVPDDYYFLFGEETAINYYKDFPALNSRDSRTCMTDFIKRILEEENYSEFIFEIVYLENCIEVYHKFEKRVYKKDNIISIIEIIKTSKW